MLGRTRTADGPVGLADRRLEAGWIAARPLSYLPVLPPKIVVLSVRQFCSRCPKFNACLATCDLEFLFTESVCPSPS